MRRQARWFRQSGVPPPMDTRNTRGMLNTRVKAFLECGYSAEEAFFGPELGADLIRDERQLSHHPASGLVITIS
jgi:hypothetical protein